MQNGEVGRAANGQVGGASFGPKYEQHMAEMQKHVEEANQKFGPLPFAISVHEFLTVQSSCDAEQSLSQQTGAS